jgi:hypothetical protein
LALSIAGDMLQWGFWSKGSTIFDNRIAVQTGVGNAKSAISYRRITYFYVAADQLLNTAGNNDQAPINSLFL